MRSHCPPDRRSIRAPRQRPLAPAVAGVLLAGVLAASCTATGGSEAGNGAAPTAAPPDVERRLDLNDDATHRMLAGRFGRMIVPYASPEDEARADARCAAAYGPGNVGFGVDPFTKRGVCRGPIDPADPRAMDYLRRFCKVLYHLPVRRFEAASQTLVCGAPPP